MITAEEARERGDRRQTAGVAQRRGRLNRAIEIASEQINEAGEPVREVRVPADPETDTRGGLLADLRSRGFTVTTDGDELVISWAAPGGGGG